MGLFGKKKEIRFEAITIERQRDVFRALEQRGHAVLVLSFKRQYPSFFFPGRTQKDEGEEQESSSSSYSSSYS